MKIFKALDKKYSKNKDKNNCKLPIKCTGLVAEISLETEAITRITLDPADNKLANTTKNWVDESTAQVS